MTYFESVTILLIGIILGFAMNHFAEPDLIHSKPSWYKDEACIRWESDPATVQKVFDEYEAEHGIKILGLADLQTNTIYVPEPKTARQLQTLGHEVLHIFRGVWHPHEI